MASYLPPPFKHLFVFMQVLYEVECMQSMKKRSQLSSRVAGYVHYLRPMLQATDSGETDNVLIEWQGKLKESDRRVKSTVAALKTEMMGSLDEKLEAQRRAIVQEILEALHKAGGSYRSS
jgi:hypothetical protein